MLNSPTLQNVVAGAAALLVVAIAATASAQIDVVATLPTLGSLARDVGGDDVRVEVLAVPSQDPHYVDGRPSFIVSLHRADILVANGLDLEAAWLEPLQTQARNADITVGGRGFVQASDFVQPLEVPTGRVDRSMGDIHPGGNPHFWFDPRQMAEVALGMGERFALVDPEHASAYRQRAESVARDLRAFADEERARFAALPDDARQIVSFHRSLSYLVDWLDLSVVAEVEPRPGIPPDPGHVASVLSTMRATGADVIVQEEFYPTSSTDTLARLTEAELLVIAGGADFEGGESYLEYVERVVDALYTGLQR